MSHIGAANAPRPSCSRARWAIATWRRLQVEAADPPAPARQTPLLGSASADADTAREEPIEPEARTNPGKTATLPPADQPDDAPDRGHRRKRRPPLPSSGSARPPIKRNFDGAKAVL